MSKLQRGKVLAARPAGQFYQAIIDINGKKMTGMTQYPIEKNQSLDISVSGMFSRTYYINDPNGRTYSFNPV